MEQITIRVTRDDLKGHFIDNYDCPIARAAKRHFDCPVFVIPCSLRMIDFPYETYKYSTWSNNKAHLRSYTLFGKIMGGFDVVLTKEENQ